VVISPIFPRSSNASGLPKGLVNLSSFARALGNLACHRISRNFGYSRPTIHHALPVSSFNSQRWPFSAFSLASSGGYQTHPLTAFRPLIGRCQRLPSFAAIGHAVPTLRDRVCREGSAACCRHRSRRGRPTPAALAYLLFRPRRRCCPLSLSFRLPGQQ
jgi:hypothetical protein